MRAPRHFAPRPPRHIALRPPRRTVRLRLTLVYGGLFLASGAALLAITYVLVRQATDDDPLTYQGPNGMSSSVYGAAPPDAPPGDSAVGGPGAGDPPSPDRIRELALRQRADQMHQLLSQSGVALAIMAVLSIGLGWLVAGRILRPIRTITAATRDISATSLHRRLALAGPGDELKELGDTIDGLLARLEASFKAQRAFVANASHELRTPLARQRTVAQVALADPDATVESLRRSHERVLAAGAQQERLIEALLTLARGQAGLDRRERFDLADLSGLILVARRGEAERRGIDLHTALAPAPAAGDPRLAERLAANLVDNALRHNAAAGGRIDVVTGIRDGRAVLSVANTGPEIPATDVGRLFQPFQRLGAERAGHGRGLGLGLSIVEAIAAAHDAAVEATPRSGGGLEVTVSFAGDR